MTPTRRNLLKTAACGFGSLALAGLSRDATASTNPLAPRSGHHPATAKRIIFLFMQGGPSQVDSFDQKPELDRLDGKNIDFTGVRFESFGKVSQRRLMKALWSFKNYGQTGQPVSELFPHLGQHVDDLCFIHSMHTEGVAHGPSTLFMQTGATNLVRPSMGSWVSYGLGTENDNLPAFVTIMPSASKGGPRNHSNAFLPAVYQGPSISRPGQPAREATMRHISNTAVAPDIQRKRFNLLQALNREQLRRTGENDRLEATIESFELAARMQMNAPGVLDISNESKATLEMYGIGEGKTEDFGRQCLMARRLAERGVRYIQVNYSDESATPRWDQHGNMPKHADHAAATDKPAAGLLADLKQRGLLEDTLVWWGGEFGRTPFAQGKDGRDHNPRGFTVFLAGGGVKAGFVHGATDEIGHLAVKDKVHMHDLHATILHLLGIDHERLTYRYAGRDFRLTDVFGGVVHNIIA
ncbi:MAG: DUF1501 domain-containing protein [Planctomycetota bacterium]|nr:DUF1501 domain-containing protein [Planctomycetota bacterium]